MDFDVRNFGVINIGPIEVWITETLIVTWIIIAILTLFAIIVRIKLRSFTDEPKGFQNFIELTVEGFGKFFDNSAGEKLSVLGGWFFTVFAFLLVSNTIGIFGVRPPSADWPLPLGLALITFILIQVVGLRYRGWGYLKSFFEPFFPFFPINVLGELARPISLSFRMFGNVLGGMILLQLVYGIAPVVLRFILPWALHVYFDIVSGMLQAFIFTVLSLTYLGVVSKTADEA